MPRSPLSAISIEEEVSPAAPMSWMATMASPAISSRHASISSFSVKGSPTWTVGRLASESSLNSAEADIDDAGILARAPDHARPRGRQRLQPSLRGFVGAMLAPHHREDAELGEVRHTTENDHRAHVFLGGQAVLGDDVGRNLAHAADAPISARAMPSKRPRPSTLQSSSSVASSGCGMRPSTVFSSLKMPAMLRAEPLWLSASVSSPAGEE